MEVALLEAQTSIRDERHIMRACVTGATGLLLGVLLVVQLQTQNDIRRTAAAAGPEPMVVLSTLVEANARLRQERAGLEFQLDEFQSTSGQEQLTSLVEELNRLRLANGLVEVKGPGVDLTIEASLSPLEMHDLVNELRNAGAEALALNTQRLVASSAIASKGDNLLLDGEVLAAPYVLQAIGHPQDMETALTRRGGLIPQLALAHEGLRVEMTQRVQMVLPVYSTSRQFEYARPIE